MAKFFQFPKKVLDNYTCRGTPLLLPYPSDSVVKTGFVTMTINKKRFLENTGPAKRITIGNKSYLEFQQGTSNGGNNTNLYGKPATRITAIDRPFIKSFRYGFTNKASVEIVVCDSNGGAFTQFIRSIPDTCAEMQNYPDYAVKVNYGWVYQDISGNVKKYDLRYTQNITYLPDPEDPRDLPVDAGDVELNLLIRSIDINNSNGLWLYKIELNDVTYVIKRDENLRSDKDTPGTDANKVHFSEAVDQLMQECGVKKDDKSHFAKIAVSDTRNASQTPNGAASAQGRVLRAFKFAPSAGGAKGPLNVYMANNQNSMDVIRSYANGVVTSEGNGMVFTLDARSNRPYLYIVEDNFTKDQGTQATDCVPPPIATYVINGGSASPVLGFDIQVNIKSIQAIGGSGPNPTGTQIVDGDKVEPEPGKKAYGVETFIPIPADVTNYRAPSTANAAETDAIFKNSKASQIYESPAKLSATMTLIGDPWYVNCWAVLGQTISIIYLEAFSVGHTIGNSAAPRRASTGVGDAGCDYLITENSVNNYISGKQWTINSVSHEITEDGRFTTMLEISKLAQQEG